MRSKLICIDDIARHFEVTPATIRNWIKKRDFPGKKIGGVWRFEWSQVYEWENSFSSSNYLTSDGGYKDYLSATAALSLSTRELRLPIETNSLTLINDDCVRVLSKLNDNSVDLLLTDPPYNLGIFMQRRATNLKQLRQNYFGAAGWDNLDPDEWVKSMDIFFSEISRILRKGGSAIVFMAVIKVETLINIAQKYGLYYKTTGTWHKTNPMPRNMNLQFINSTESWVYFVNNARTGTFNNNGKAQHDFFETSVASRSERHFGTHPTQKPIKLMNYFVKILSNPGDTVLDPFMGSGTTGVSALAQGRQFIGIELSEKYFDIAANRLGVSK